MKIKSILARIILSLNSLLLFLVIFQEWLVVPVWLQVIGRIHPLFLHFPIVLVLLYAVGLLFRSKLRNDQGYSRLMDALLFTAALSCSLTALMGFFLSTGEGYDPEAMMLHKWSGVAIALLLHIVVVFRKKIDTNMYSARITAGVLTCVIVVAGHFGSVITHGENFVFEPLSEGHQRSLPNIEEAIVYADLVLPILEDKCISCHNSKKTKGELRMDARELLIKGGKSGHLWDTTEADLGLMLRRIHLPQNHKKHMPPAGKPQLTNNEITILHQWIRMGSDFDQKVTDLPLDDTLYLLAKNILPSSSERTYDFPAADEASIKKLNNNNRLVRPLALGSPALQVSFYNSQLFTSESLKELKSVAGQIVELNVANMPVADEDIVFIAQLKNLEKLNLSFTGITGKTLNTLRSLSELQTIALTGTKVEQNYLRELESFPGLNSAYIWNTSAAENYSTERTSGKRQVSYHAGYDLDTISLQLTPPLLKNKNMVIDSFLLIKMNHNIAGSTIRYTLDGKEPDSVNSPVYKDAVRVHTNSTLKARAFKSGWMGSDIMKAYFFKRTYLPDTVMIKMKPHDESKLRLVPLLFDGEKSDVNFASQKWLFFKGKELEIVMKFDSAITCSNVTLSILEHLSDGIFPPRDVVVYTGNDLRNLSVAAKVKPVQSSTMKFRENLGIECNFKPVSARYIKIIIYPEPVIPAWHQLKGGETSLYIDEIFVN